MVVFVRYGFRLTSMEMVGQEAGLTRQAVYHHFDSKEALFRAVAESVNAAAQAAAVAAGQRAEAAGGDLADVLIAQMAARWRYYAERLDGSPHADELVSEQLRQSQGPAARMEEQKAQLTAETVARHVERGARLRPGMTPDELVRCVQLAERGAKSAMGAPDAPKDLERLIRLLVAGALAPAPAT